MLQQETKRMDEVEDPVIVEEKASLAVNNLRYEQPKALSVAKSRTFVKQYFQRSDYTSAPGKTAVIDFNTGSSYINCANSYLKFSVAVISADAGTFTFGSGSAMNMIDRVTIRSKSGVELCRLDNAALWAKIDMDYTAGDEYLGTVASASGYGRTLSTSAAGTTTIPLTIMLPYLAPFFRPIKGQLLPATLASGLHIELVFNTAAASFVKAAGTAVTDYNISSIEMVLDSIELSDDSMRALNFESAKSGLEWVCPAVYTATNSVPSGQSQVNIQISKAVSQAVSAVCVPQDSADLTDGTVDSFQSDLPALGTDIRWQMRVGHLYYPNQEVREVGTTAYPESYMMSLNAFDKLRFIDRPCSVTITDFTTGTKGILATSFSRNDSMFLTGQPLNNSRSLALDVTFNGASKDRRFTTFLYYIEVVKSYTQNSAVAI